MVNVDLWCKSWIYAYCGKGLSADNFVTGLLQN
jgi:hypothetical protein